MRRRLCLVVALAAALAVLPLGAVAHAPAQQSSNLDQLNQQRTEADAQEQAARAQLATIQGKRAQLDAALSAVNAQVAAATARLAAAQAEADRIEGLYTALVAQVNQTQAELDKEKARVRATAVLLYQDSGTNDLIGLFTSAHSIGETVEGTNYLEHVSALRRNDVQRVGRLRSALATQQAQLETQRKASQDARTAAFDEKSKLDALAAQQQQARDAAASQEQSENATIASIRVHEAQLDSQIQAESDAIAASLRNAGDGPVPGGNHQFIRPVNGPITSPYGTRIDPITGATSFHPGVDFGAACGTPIKAAGSGVIFSAGWNGGYGNATIINHGGGIATLYGHQSRIAVSVGQTVSQGQIIGYVGTTGYSTGCHLHWEVRVNGATTNPLAYL